MSTKRIIGIMAFGGLLIVAVVVVMLVTLLFRRDIDAVGLPVSTPSLEAPGETQPDALDRVEVTRETIQHVVAELNRPDNYRRDIIIESYWDGGHNIQIFSVSVSDGVTSLLTQPSPGVEKRIVVTADTQYIWYRGDRTPFASPIGTSGDGIRTADEWQMMITYEDLLNLDVSDIIEAGFTEYGGQHCVYAVYLSPLLGHTMRYYVSVDLGLVIGAEEFDVTSTLIYAMRAGECIVGGADPAAFILPDGRILLES